MVPVLASYGRWGIGLRCMSFSLKVDDLWSRIGLWEVSDLVRAGPTVLDLCLRLRVCMFGLFVSHPSSDPPPGLGGSGVGNLMGDLCRLICP